MQPAEQSLNDVVKKLQGAFEASPEYTAAQKELTAAEAANHAAQAAVLAKLAKDPAYVSAVEHKEKAVKDVQAAQDTGSGTSPELATAVMEAGKDKAKIENDAFAADPPSTESKAKVLAVGRPWRSSTRSSRSRSSRTPAGRPPARRSTTRRRIITPCWLRRPRPLSLKLSREPERPDRPPLVNPPPPPTDSGWAGDAKGRMSTDEQIYRAITSAPARKSRALPRTAPSA